MGLLDKLTPGGWISDGIDSILNGAEKIVDTTVTNEEEKMNAKRKLKDTIQNFKLQLKEQEFKRYSEAHKTYRKDGSLQKVYAIVFLVGYIALTGVMVYFLFDTMREETKIMNDIPQWGISLISMIYGAMSSKVNTITDFLFGSSSGSQKKDNDIKDALNQSKTKNSE